jgi:hypothetical protein
MRTHEDMSGFNEDAEGANLEQAKPDETLRQKDPALDIHALENPPRDTDGVKLVKESNSRIVEWSDGHGSD